MQPAISDTNPEMERVHIEGVRSLPAGRKLEMVSELTSTVRQLALAGLRARFPGATAGELHRRLATLCLGAQLAEKVYGPEPSPPTVL